MTNIITGIDAIEYAEQKGLLLNKYADPVEDAREGLSIDEAHEVATEDPSLIWIEVTGTTAEAIADIMGNDGQHFEAEDGRALEDICEAHGGTAEHRGDGATRYTFEDGSAIAMVGSGWDVEGAEPFSWASA